MLWIFTAEWFSNEESTTTVLRTYPCVSSCLLVYEISECRPFPGVKIGSSEGLVLFCNNKDHPPARMPSLPPTFINLSLGGPSASCDPVMSTTPSSVLWVYPWWPCLSHGWPWPLLTWTSVISQAAESAAPFLCCHMTSKLAGWTTFLNSWWGRHWHNNKMTMAEESYSIT